MDDLTMLREVRSAEPGPSAAETTAARNALLTAIEAAGRSPVGCRATQPRSATMWAARHRIWVPVMAAAATIAVGAGVLTLAPGSSQLAASRPGTKHHARRVAPVYHQQPAGPVAPTYHKATLTAAVVLDNAAAAAARQDEATGKYFFTESEGIGSAGIATIPGMTVRVGPSLSRSWFGNGVDGRLIQSMVIPGFSWIPRNRVTALSPSSDGAGMTWAQMQALPTAQAQLLAIVARLAPANYPEPAMQDPLTIEEFGYIGQLLWGNPIPPAVQAALYRVAAGLPGIKVIDTTDLVGRPAVEVYLWDRAMLFSPVTFQLLGEATIDPANVSCPVGGSGAILATGYVGSDTQLPAGTPTKLEPAYYSNSAPGCPTLLTRFPRRVMRQIVDRRERRLRH
jgi:hypothetical protein